MRALGFTSFSISLYENRASQVVLVVKNPPANVGDIKDLGSIPGLGRSPGGGHGNPLQYHWKNHSFDYMEFCQQSDVTCFLILCLGLS